MPQKIKAAQVSEEVWDTYTPTVTASAGSFTSVSASGRYKKVGKTVTVTLLITITTNGTATGAVNATLPFSTHATGQYVGAGRADGVSGKALQVIANKSGVTICTIWNYDNTYPGASGELLKVTVTYESA